MNADEILQSVCKLRTAIQKLGVADETSDVLIQLAHEAKGLHQDATIALNAKVKMLTGRRKLLVRKYRAKAKW